MTAIDEEAGHTTTFEESGGWPALLGSVAAGEDLSRQWAELAMTEILGGKATEAQIAALLMGLIAKGETVDELTGFASAMVAAAEPMPVQSNAIDIVGTGGSSHRRSHALNVSTMASIVAASAGAVVCKHGNRRASSTSGSFDFLEALGIRFDLDPAALADCIEEVGVGFAFARSFHPAMRFAGPVRAQLGIPTVFNLLGPLANPGRVTRHLVGVSSPERAEALARSLGNLGSTSAWVVSGADGLDELSTTGDSVAYTFSRDGSSGSRDGSSGGLDGGSTDVRIEREIISPAELGIEPVDLAGLVGGDAADNVAIFDRVLAGEIGPYRDIVALNAGAGLVVSGVESTLAGGLASAASAIDDGRAKAKVAQLKEATTRLATEAGH